MAHEKFMFQEDVFKLLWIESDVVIREHEIVTEDLNLTNVGRVSKYWNRFSGAAKNWVTIAAVCAGALSRNKKKTNDIFTKRA